MGLGLVLLAAPASPAATVFTKGVLKREFFSGATRATVEDGSAGAPTSISVLSAFDAPVGVADNYAQRISGYFTPAKSGDYVFFVSSDDDSDLFISTDENPANKRLIAQETGWSNPRIWLNTGDGSDNGGGTVDTKRSDSNFGTLSLVANKKYYIEGVHHEGGGGDNFAATFKLASEEDPANSSASTLTGDVIGADLEAQTVQITSQPASVTTIEGVRADFSVTTTYTGVVAPTYQWSKNGAPITGATGSKYTTPILATSDSGAKFTVKVTVPGQELTSSEAILTVNSDTVPPKIVSAGGIHKGTGIEVGVIFDEAVDPATIVAANFKLSAGTVSAARHLPNSSGNLSLESGAVLTTTGLSEGNTYQVTVTGVKDIKGNTVAASTASLKVSKMNWAALGEEPAAFPAAAVAVGDNGFNVNSGGNAFWNTQDDVTFVYEEVSGDFDKIMRVEYQDNASQWARAGLTARTSLDGVGETAARYQNTHANPPGRADGGTPNNSFETNRRLSVGAATTGSGGGGTPKYPNAWVRLRRAGDVMHMYRSEDAITWIQLGYSNFNPEDGSNPDGPLPAKMLVGPVYGPENGNNTEEFRKLWAVRFRDYGDFKASKTRGAQTYAIGVAFARSEPNGVGSWMGPTEIAGLNQVAQGNWNNVDGANTDTTGAISLKAEVGGAAQNSSATIEWTCPNTWSSTGRGEENNALTGSDRQLLVGYLDTGNATTTKVTVKALPSQLTSAGYDVVVYALGGVSGRGGGYRLTDINGTEIKPVVLVVAPTNAPSLEVVKPSDPAVHAPGTAIVFKNLKVNEFILEGSTENDWGFSGTPRAGINALQLVTPSGLTDQVVSTPEIAIARNGASTVITFKGTLQKAASITGPFTDVAGATSPLTVTTSDAAAFYRTH